MNVRVQVDCLRYPFSNRDVLRDISLSFNEGEFVQICGRSGAGKTTLCYLIAGIVPDFLAARMSGDVTIDGARTSEVTAEKRTATIGVVTEDPLSMLSQLTSSVAEEVSLSLLGAGFGHREVQRRIDEALSALGLSSIKGQSPETLSGGQQVRLAIASVLAVDPQLYLVDDGLGHLDRAAMRDFFRYLKTETVKGKTVIFVSNDMAFAPEYSTRVLAMEEGSVVYDGPPWSAVMNQVVRAVTRANPYLDFYLSFRQNPSDEKVARGFPLTFGELMAAIPHLKNGHHTPQP